MLHPAQRFALAFLLFTAAVAVVPLRAQSPSSFPKEKPAFTVTVPAGFRVDYATPPGKLLMTVDSADGVSSFSVETLPEDAGVEDEEGAKAALTKLIEADLAKQRFTAVTCSEPTVTTVAGHKAFSTKVSATYHERPYANEFTMFTPDGATYFLANCKDKGAAVLASIKPAP